MIVRYVRLLTESQRHTLAEIMQHDAIPRARVRAHGILLSSQGMRIKAIAKIYQVDRDTVATWIKQWEQSGMASLYDKPRSGRPPKLTPEEKDLARQYISPFALSTLSILNFKLPVKISTQPQPLQDGFLHP